MGTEGKTATPAEAFGGLAFAVSVAAGITVAAILLAGLAVLLFLAWLGSGPAPLRPFNGPAMRMNSVTRVRIGRDFGGPFPVDLRGEDAKALATLIGRRAETEDDRDASGSQYVVFRLDGEWDAYITGFIEPDRRRITFQEIEGKGGFTESLGTTAVEYTPADIPAAAAGLFGVDKSSETR